MKTGQEEKKENGSLWIIKAGFPDDPVKMKWWSEYVFANSLKKYLIRLGIRVIIHSAAEWKSDEDSNADVVLVLRGAKEYFPHRNLKSDTIYIMWNLSHPSTISDEEYNAYDMVCIASPMHTKVIERRARTLVRFLPMCADTEIFYPAKKEPQEFQYDWIFVGNSKYIKRKSVDWSLQCGIQLHIWGTNWDKVLPQAEEHVEAVNIPNNALPGLYRSSRVTVDDHYEDMARHGFINTRIVEALACGLPVITDYSETVVQMFGDAVLCYKDRKEFEEQIRAFENHQEEIRGKARKLWPIIHERYSFEACSKKLVGYVRELADIRSKAEQVITNFNAKVEPDPDVQAIFREETDMTPKVSVIIPVYGTEKYLPKCLESVIHQSLKELEIICIEDGTMDHSRSILLDYAKKDPRISVYAQKNRGSGAARNQGMQFAHGEYLYFLDSDDYLDEDALGWLYQYSKENRLDLLLFNGTTFYEDGLEKKYWSYASYYQRKGAYPRRCSGKDLFCQMWVQEEYRVSVVMQFFSRIFLEREKLYFLSPCYHEDYDFSFRAILLADRAGYIDRAFYHRRIHAASVSTNGNRMEDVYGYFKALMNMVSFAKEHTWEAPLVNVAEDVFNRVYAHLMREYRALNDIQKSAFGCLNIGERYEFDAFVFSLEERAREKSEERNDQEITKLRNLVKDLQEEKKKKTEELRSVYAKKREVYAKLHQAYAEKSEINRKLQVTYGEKYERGIKIKKLKKQIESIKRSKTYRLARIIGYPLRALRKLFRGMNRYE